MKTLLPYSMKILRNVSSQNVMIRACMLIFFASAFLTSQAQNTLNKNGSNFYLDGGVISTTDATTICVDGIGDPIDVTLDGAKGFKKKWIITDDSGKILGLPEAPPFDLDGAGPGTCLIWNISYFYLRGLEVGNNALTDLYGIFDLSNSLSVTRNLEEGGELLGGPFVFEVDGEADMASGISLSGNSGSNSIWEFRE